MPEQSQSCADPYATALTETFSTIEDVVFNNGNTSSDQPVIKYREHLVNGMAVPEYNIRPQYSLPALSGFVLMQVAPGAAEHFSVTSQQTAILSFSPNHFLRTGGATSGYIPHEARIVFGTKNALMRFDDVYGIHVNEPNKSVPPVATYGRVVKTATVALDAMRSSRKLDIFELLAMRQIADNYPGSC